MLSRLPLISGRISFDNEIEFGVRDTDYKVVWSLDNNAERGENVEDMLEENEETGSILQYETNKEDTKKTNLLVSVEKGKDREEDSDAKQETLENKSK